MLLRAFAVCPLLLCGGGLRSFILLLPLDSFPYLEYFSPQVRALWRLCIVTIVWVIWDQRNKRIFEGSCSSISSLLAAYWASIREAGGGITASMRSSLDDLAILSAFGVKGRPPRAPNIKCVRWQAPPVNVIKVNVDGGVVGSPGSLTGGGVFRDSFGVFRGYFAVSHGRGFAFEAELASALFAIELARDKGWKNIWLEASCLLARWHRPLASSCEMASCSQAEVRYEHGHLAHLQGR
ncbi:hypothetical protein ACS0TY_005000 [Phlomoides rotata]